MIFLEQPVYPLPGGPAPLYGGVILLHIVQIKGGGSFDFAQDK